MSVIIGEVEVVVESPEQQRGTGADQEPPPFESPPLTAQELQDVERRQHARQLRVRAS